jgi:hypothetical protein
VLSETDPRSAGPQRHVLRFGQHVRGDDIASISSQRRAGAAPPTGRLEGVALLSATGQAWLRMSQRGRLPWQRRPLPLLPLSPTQPAQPPQDAAELQGGTRVRCHDGYVGKIEGLTVDAASGHVLDLLVRVRADVLAEVESAASPFAKLVPLAGQVVTVPPAWLSRVAGDKSAGPLSAEEPVAHLDASPEQIASGMLIRSDGDITADIWRMLEDNPAIAPYFERITVDVRDGRVTLRGTVPSPRHKLTVEQDVWHVPGVFDVVNNLRVGT